MSRVRVLVATRKGAFILTSDAKRQHWDVSGRDAGAALIRVLLPLPLRTLARVEGEVELRVEGEVTQRSVLDALEAAYPVLRGTIRGHETKERRAFVRFFACERDLP